jgi:hypothetical protein
VHSLSSFGSDQGCRGRVQGRNHDGGDGEFSTDNDNNDNDDRRMEVFTNLTATLVANATPYVRNALSAEVAAASTNASVYRATTTNKQP